MVSATVGMSKFQKELLRIDALYQQQEKYDRGLDEEEDNYDDQDADQNHDYDDDDDYEDGGGRGRRGKGG